jgi:hypothetical protein
MPEIQASRRLVKSPPELWAEVSDAACLARHLGDVGEIAITRLEPETTVAWEGETASGTVALAPAGWGTSVTLTAQPTGEAAEADPEPEPAAAIPEPTPAAAAPQRTPEAEQPTTRRSWFQRLFGKRRAAADGDRAGGAGETISAAPPAASSSPATGPARQAAEAQAHQEPDPLKQVLTSALDSLGQAHHRPFSRG